MKQRTENSNIHMPRGMRVVGIVIPVMIALVSGVLFLQTEGDPQVSSGKVRLDKSAAQAPSTTGDPIEHLGEGSRWAEPDPHQRESSVAALAQAVVQDLHHQSGSAGVPALTGAGARVLEMLDQAEILQTEQTSPDVDGKTLRRRLMKTDRKYPLIHVEETIRVDAVTGEEEILDAVAMVADHVVVKLSPGASEADLQSLNTQFGATIRKKLGSTGLYLVAFTAPDVDTVSAAMAEYSRHPVVVGYVEPDYLVHTSALVPNDPRFHELWGMENVDDTDIDVTEAWDEGVGSPDSIVGIIDTGIDYAHEDLRANMWENPHEIPSNGLDDDGNGYTDDVHGWDFANNDADPMDDNFHGTHCAGTVGAVGNNGIGVVGVAWHVRLVALKFLDAEGGGYLSDGVEAIEYATSIGVDLTSNSWGGGGFSRAMKDAIDRAHAAGILFVAAAGNDHTNTDASPHYPSCYSSENIISVAATDRRDRLASFSNFGMVSVDLAAPGVEILSSAPGHGYRELSGTSMATPHVAGALALLKHQNPQLGHMELRQRVLDTANAIPWLAGQMVTGGRLNVADGQYTPPPSQDDSWDPGDDTGDGGVALRTPDIPEQRHGPHTLSATDYSDWFVVTMTAGLNYNFNTSGGSGDTVGALYSDPYGQNRVAYDDDSGSGLMFSLTYQPSASGTYYMLVQTYSQAEDAAYLLHYSVSESSPGDGDAWDPSDNQSQGATALSPPSSHEQTHGLHSLSAADHYDWYEMSLTAGVEYNFNSIGGNGDTYAELYADPDGTERVAYDDDSGGNLMFNLTHTPPTSGTYFLRVRAYRPGDSASYNLRYRLLETVPVLEVTREHLERSVPEGRCPPAHTIAVRNAGGGVMEYALETDVPWMQVSPARGESHGETDSVSVFYDSDGLVPDVYGGTIRVTAEGAANPVHVIEVILTVRPFGIAVENDFDGDGLTDLAVVNPVTAEYAILESSTQNERVVQSGLRDVLPAPGDYDGDGVTDVAVFQPQSGQWEIVESRTGFPSLETFGTTGMIPVPGDYDADGKADLALYDVAQGYWHVRYSSNSADASFRLGVPGVVPVPGDYDGDGATDLAIYHAPSGIWVIRNSSTSSFRFAWLGWSGAAPVPADYDADGITDIAVYHPPTGGWFVHYSGSGRLGMTPFGHAQANPLSGDYDGDGFGDCAIYEVETGVWGLLESSDGQDVYVPWSRPGSVPANPQFLIRRLVP